MPVLDYCFPTTYKRRWPRNHERSEYWVLGGLTIVALLGFSIGILIPESPLCVPTFLMGWCVWVGAAATLPWRYVFTGSQRIWAAILAAIGTLLALDGLLWGSVALARRFL